MDDSGGTSQDYKNMMKIGVLPLLEPPIDLDELALSSLGMDYLFILMTSFSSSMLLSLFYFLLFEPV